MNESLRPSTLGEILDRTAQLYRRNFWLFAGVAAMPVGVMVLIGAFGGVLLLAIPGVAGAPGRGVIVGAALVVALLVTIPVYLAAYVLSTAGLTQAAISAQSGEKLTIRGALMSVQPRFGTYLWFLVLQGVVVVLVPGLAAGGAVVLPIYLATRAGGGLAAGVAIGFVAVLVGAAAIGAIVWLALSYAMGMAVCVAEQKAAWKSMKRSWKLSQGTRGRIFVLFLLVLVLTMVTTMIAYIPFLIVVGVAAAAGNGPQSAAAALVVAEILQFVLDVLLQIALTPISSIALVLFYYDQRVRKEGFDIEVMMEQAGLTQLTSAVAPPSGAGVISVPALPPDTVEER